MRLLGVHRLHYRMGGAEGVHLDHLALFRERGWDCAEFAMAHPDNEPSEYADYFPSSFDAASGGIVKKLAQIPRYFHSSEARANFDRLLEDFKPDIIHAHGIYHHLTPAILKPARTRGIPIVYTLHDYKLICPAYHFFTEKAGVCEKCRGGRQWQCLAGRCSHGSLAQDALFAIDGLVQWHSGTILNAVSRFIGPCQFIVDKFAEHGFPRDKLRCVPNFFESADDQPVPPQAIEELRARHGRFALFFGRLSAEKGVDRLLEACRQTDTPLVVVGDGPKMGELREHAQRIGLPVSFEGHRRGAELWQFVEAATAIVLPSVWYEIAPKSILEAQARGKVVITTSIGGLPEMVEHHKTGFLAAPGDVADLAACLREAFAMPQERLDAMGEVARNRALTTFTRERYYQEMTDIYAELMVPAGAVAAATFA